ncbi:aggregation-promoting factor C-terminal-like domain-containing protein [Actinomadura algeriensis]
MLTSNVTITAVCLCAIAAFLVFVPIGGDDDDGAPPEIAAAGMSANEMLEMMQGSEMDPVAADAMATAKKRAYEKQQAEAKQKKAEKNSEDSAKSSFDKPEPESPAGGGGAIPDAPAGGGDTSVSQNKAIGKRMNALKGWSGCWSALESLWTKESGWNERAQNPSSGAYGIPQSLPGTKMASAGSDWQTNAATQIAWGLNYIDARYGTPCEAWGHSQSVGWY